MKPARHGRSPASRHAAELRSEVERWWLELPEALRSRAWPAALAALTAVYLLLAFHQVVRDAVHQGEALRMSTASPSEAVWRCNALRGLHMRENCLAQLNAPARDEAALPDEKVAQLGR